MTPGLPGVSPDSAAMRRALDLALRGWGQTAPNPMVGAVVVREGVVVGEGWHERYGEAHAEVNALRAAGARARGATMYVTLEPCAHFGKTPPCADAIIAAGIARCVIAARDPGPGAGGAERLRAAGIEVETGVEVARAVELNAAFFHALESDRPWITLKLALSLDGALTDATRARAWLTGARARCEVHRLRAGHDAVAVGIGTVLADDPMLTVRDWEPPRVSPARVVFDRTARLPLGSALVRTAGEAPVVVLATQPDAGRASALQDAGVTVLTVDDMAMGMRELRARGLQSLFVEGGAGIAGALMKQELVDRLIIFRAPVVLGAGALNAFADVPAATLGNVERWRVLETRAFDDDVMTVYAHPGRF